MPPPLAVLPPRRRPSAASLVGLDFSANALNTSLATDGDSPQTARSDTSSSTASTSSSASTIGSSTVAGTGSEIASSSGGGGDFEDQLRNIRIDNERRLQASSESLQSAAAEGEVEVEEDHEAVMARAVIEAKSWKAVSEHGFTIDRY